jgi:hypothetical protein
MPASRDPTAFPLIREWLQELDAGPRGADGHNFQQYANDFKENRIYRISEIADATSFTRAELLQICPSMKFGTANNLLTYAREDVRAIRRNGHRNFN